MKKIYFLGLTLFCLNTINVFAEVPSEEKEKIENVNETVATTLTWEFFSAHEDPSVEILKTVSRSCKLGEKSSYFYNLFKETYVVKEEVVPGDPTRRTVIKKPEIYNSVKKIEKYLNKSLKSGSESKDILEDKFCHVLKVSLAAIDSDTDTFEESLKDNKRNPEALLSIFENVSLRNIY